MSQLSNDLEFGGDNGIVPETLELYDGPLGYNETILQEFLNLSSNCSNSLCINEDDYAEIVVHYMMPDAFEWILISFHLLVFIVGLLGNALVCISVYRNHAMRTVTNYFIVNLAVADFLVILICLPPTVLWDVTETWWLGSIMCKVIPYLQYVSVCVSVLTLTFISVDRWYAICYPLRSLSTPARAKTAIFFIWLISCIIMLPDLISMDTKSGPIKNYVYLTDCGSSWDPSVSSMWELFRVFFLYIIPFALMSFVYYKIARVLWNKNIPGVSGTQTTTQACNHHYNGASTETNNSLLNRSAASSQSCQYRNGAIRLNQSMNANPNREGQIRSRRKAAKMLIAVVTIFGFCYFPVHLINLLRCITELPQTPLMSVLSLLSHWLCYFNSAINPIVYNFMSGKFRNEYRRIFGDCFMFCRCAGYR